MKTYSRYTLLIFWVFSGCVEMPHQIPQPLGDNQPSLQSIQFSDQFNWSGEKTLLFTFHNQLNYAPVGITFFGKDPSGAINVYGKTYIKSSVTPVWIQVPKSIDGLYYTTDHLLMRDRYALPLAGGDVQFRIGLMNMDQTPMAFLNSSGRMHTSFLTIGSWNALGVPTYLVPTNDSLSQTLIDDVFASLPESRPVPSFNPEYLTGEILDTKIIDEADVWITFVSEGAGWRNALGYYTYHLSNPPASLAQIQNHTLIFPNASMLGSGGGLLAGNKVFLGRFPANTGIGWFLVPNGWNGSTVQPSNSTKYSNPAFNTFTSQAHRQHFILLQNPEAQLVLIGIEDTNRPGGDNDFNDALFYVTANPYTAIETGSLKQMKTAVDTDGDGVLDHLDEYPLDSLYASRTLYPAGGGYHTLAFEDMWPSIGDYDFNDLVVDFRYIFKMNAANHVRQWEAEIVLRAAGAGHRNGFAIQLNCSDVFVKNVTGAMLSGACFTTNGRGTEANNTKAVVPVWDNHMDLFGHGAAADFINTEPSGSFRSPVSRKVLVDFHPGVRLSDLGTLPLNPFITVGGVRGREVHLINQKPTEKASNILFGSDADASIPSQGKFYRSALNLPWALHIDGSFQYPKERTPIHLAFLRFVDWALSNGTQHTDWHQNKANYRNPSLIYIP